MRAKHILGRIAVGIAAITLLGSGSRAEQVVEIKLVEDTKAEVRVREKHVLEYELDEEEVKLLSRLLWSSPLRNEGYKKDLLWVVFNRVDRGYPFGASIKEVVTKKEFTFFDRKAHLSEENDRIVREALREWKSWKNGCYVGEHIPGEGLYIRFRGEKNRVLEVLDGKDGDIVSRADR